MIVGNCDKNTDCVKNKSNNIRMDPVFIFLLVAAVVLLFSNLGNMYLWEDEAETSVLARNILKYGYPRAFDGKNIIHPELEYRADYAWTYHPWVQFYITALSFNLFGQNTFAARIPFVLLGILAVVLIYLLALRLTKNRTIARTTMLLVVFSVPFLLHVRQCRWYALAMCFTPWLLLAYLDFVEDRKYAALHFIGISILFFHSNHGIFIAVFGGLFIHYFIFYRRRKRLKQILMPLAVIASLTLPWLIYSIAWQHFTFLYTKGWQREPFELDHIRQNLEFYFRVINKYIIPLAFLSVVALFRLIRFKINPFSAKTVKCTSVWLILLVVFSSISLLLFVDQRFFRYIAHLISLLLILEAIVLLDWWRSSKFVTGLVMAVIIFTNIFNNPKIRFYFFNYLYEITHDYDGPNEGIVKYLKQNAQPGQDIKMPYGIAVILFYTDLVIDGDEKFSKETYPDWIIIRKSWMDPAFFKSTYFYQIKKRYERIVLDYPDIRWENRPDLGYHLFRTPINCPKITIYRKTEDRSGEKI